MQIFKRTTSELARVEFDAADLVNLEIKINNTVYTLCERDGALQIGVEGQIAVLPISFNRISLSAT